MGAPVGAVKKAKRTMARSGWGAETARVSTYQAVFEAGLGVHENEEERHLGGKHTQRPWPFLPNDKLSLEAEGTHVIEIRLFRMYVCLRGCAMYRSGFFDVITPPKNESRRGWAQPFRTRTVL